MREGLAQHKVAGGALTIPTYAGGVAAAPLVQQELPDGAWQVTTKVTIDPRTSYQQAGLLLYASDTDYLKLDIGQAKPGRVVELVSAGSPSFTRQQRYQASEIWLRLTSDGAQIEGSVSSDGVNFARIGSLLSAESAPDVPRFTHVGPFAFRGGAATPEIDARFDWFRFSPSTATYDECTGDPGDPGELALTLAQGDLAPGDEQTATGMGFRAGEKVVGVMNSDPLDLGARIADADGAVVFIWTIPQDAGDGIHAVTLTGDESGEVSAEFRVTADADDGVPGDDDADSDDAGSGPADGGDADNGATDLATTGADPGVVWAVGLLLLVAGGAVLLIRRRRRLSE